MIDDNERYFPNHKIDRDIGLAEYAAAANKLHNDERAITWSTSASVILGTVVGYVSLNSSTYAEELSNNGIDPSAFRIILLFAILAFSYFSIIHIGSLLKSLVFAERKIVVLRRMLGVSYGDTTLVLPNWRIEGAYNPFALKLFPGYFSPSSFPVHVILLTTSLSIFVLSVDILQLAGEYIGYFEEHPQRGQMALSVIWYSMGLALFRKQLKDSNEHFYLSVAKVLGRIVGIELIPNFEYAVYRIKLEISELHRIGADTLSAKKIAIFVEDRSFYFHGGLNIRGVARAFFGRLTGKNRGGGSSISQQLARGQFIVRPRNSIRRKIVEILLALWLEKCLSKQEILDGYLATARFENGIYGFHRAFNHFFCDKATSVEPWEAFILIERLGNIRGRFLGRRIKQLLRQAIKSEILTEAEALQCLKFYREFMGHHFMAADGDLTPDEVISCLGLLEPIQFNHTLPE